MARLWEDPSSFDEFDADFLEWLKGHVHRDDPVGDIARDFEISKGSISSQDFSPGALQALERAAREWRGVESEVEPTPDNSPAIEQPAPTPAQTQWSHRPWFTTQRVQLH